jgi:hypothetical protein
MPPPGLETHTHTPHTELSCSPASWSASLYLWLRMMPAARRRSMSPSSPCLVRFISVWQQGGGGAGGGGEGEGARWWWWPRQAGKRTGRLADDEWSVPLTADWLQEAEQATSYAAVHLSATLTKNTANGPHYNCMSVPNTAARPHLQICVVVVSEVLAPLTALVPLHTLLLAPCSSSGGRIHNAARAEGGG